MSEPEAQNEPTMEEILASIRRIISEDETEEGKPAEGAAPAAAPAPAPAEPAPAQAPAAAPAPPPAAEAGSGGADNILELTKMVAEDGSIVDLAAQKEAEAAAAEEAAPEAEPEPEAEATEEAAAAPAEEEPAAEEAAAPAEEAEAAPEDEEPAAELLKPMEHAEAEEAPAEAAAEADAGFEEPAEEPAEEPVEEIAAEEAPSEAALGQELAPADGGSEYVSAETAATATASLAAISKAAMANRQGDAIAIGGGRTLEELVRESLAPELKGWLDENLPDLVERIVREEIRKMVRRAEDQ